MNESWRGNNILLYDGYCPFCSRAAEFSKLRQQISNFEIVSMRDPEGKAIMEALEIKEIGKGMILRTSNGEVFQGHDAFVLLVANLKSESLVMKVLKGVLGPKIVAVLVYPILKIFRRVALFILRRPADL